MPGSGNSVCASSQASISRAGKRSLPVARLNGIVRRATIS